MTSGRGVPGDGVSGGGAAPSGVIGQEVPGDEASGTDGPLILHGMTAGVLFGTAPVLEPKLGISN